MSKKSIDDVIDQIEGHKDQTKSQIENEWNDIKKMIDQLEPQIKEIKEKAEKEPLITLAIVGLVAFLLGWLIGSRRK